MAKKHTFPGVYIDSGAARFLVGGVQEPLPPHVVVPPQTSFTISGQVTEAGTGKEAVVIAFSSAGSATTDAQGNYSKTVPRNWIGSSTPGIISGGTFVPTSRSYAAVVSNWTTQDFVYNGTGGFGPQPLPTTLMITGHAYNGETFDPIFELQLDINGTDSQYTSEDGYYQIEVPYGFTGTVTAVDLFGTFQPDAYVFYGLGTHSGGNDFYFYTPDPVGGPFLVSGTLFDYSDNLGYPVFWAGWQVSWNEGVATGGADGRYSFQVPAGFTGTVAFYDTWGTSTPAQYPLVNVQADQPNKNFDIYGPSYTVGGTIWNNFTNAPWAGETVRIQNYGPTEIQLTTDADGKYSIEVPWNAEFTIAPLITGDGSLSPVTDYFVQEFLWEYDDYSYNFQYWYNPPPVLRNLEGYVYDGLTLVPLSSVTIDVSDVGQPTTDVTGYWSQTVSDGYTGRATPISMTGTFDPEARGYTSLGTDATGQDFYFYLPASDGLCPVPGPDITPLSLSPDIVSVARNANDSTQHLIWTIDDSGPNVSYYDVTYGTLGGVVDTSPGGAFGVNAIVYDPVNNRVVTADYNDSITVIDPVTKTVVAQFAGPQNLGFHCLALADNGTVFAQSIDSAVPGYPNARISAIDTSIPAIVHSVGHPFFSRSICWATNIQRLVLIRGGFGSPAFSTYDPATDLFETSIITNTTTFNYENFYVPQTGHMLMGVNDDQPVRVIDIANGTSATVISTLAGSPTRVSDATIDTCHNRLFVSDGGYAVWEYDLGNNYQIVNYFDDNGNGINPTGLAHSRKSNLVYYNNYNDNTLRSLQATTSGTSAAEVVLKTVNGEVPISPGLEFNLPAIGSFQYDSVTAADETNGRFFEGNSLEARGRIINLGAKYQGYLQVAYTAQYDDQGSIDFPGQVSIYVTFGTATNSVSINTNGTTGPTVLSTYADIQPGVNYVNVQINANTGGNFTALPATSYARNTGSVSWGVS